MRRGDAAISRVFSGREHTRGYRRVSQGSASTGIPGFGRICRSRLQWPRTRVARDNSPAAPDPLSQFDEGHLLRLVHDAIIMTDLNGMVHVWNPAAERVYGFSHDEIVGNHISAVYFPEDLAGIPPEFANPVQSAANGQNLTEVIMRHGGEAQQASYNFANLGPGDQDKILNMLNALILSVSYTHLTLPTNREV